MKMEQSQQLCPAKPLTCRPWGRSTRTGSALLIVIGTLALIAVFAVIYLSIGRTDRRTANTVRMLKSQKDDVVNFQKYLSSVIETDRLDAVVQYDGLGEVFGRREVTDAPYTDWTRRSESFYDDGRDLFTPHGGPFSVGGLNQVTDQSVASDPWLASTTPVYIGYPGSTNSARPFSNYEVFDERYPNAKNFLDNRDWLQISNFAPDGRFVNLFNLRSNTSDLNTGTLNGRSFGSFFAEPGVGISQDTGGRNIRRMSNYLSLWVKADPNAADSMIQAFDPTVNGSRIWVPGFNDPVDIGLSFDELVNTPAVWTMYQRFMYMPINQSFVTLNRQGNPSSWADPDYPAYQYADADGDGMADSRWFELTAARNKDQGDADQARADIEVMYDQGSMRYFLAARAVDLSSMVNVNTATDLLVEPTKEAPLGLTPADVDLRRLLTMQDAAGDYTTFNHGMPLSFSQLHRPFRRDADNEPFWGQWDTPRPARDFVRNVSDYWMYQHDMLSYQGSLSGNRPDLRLLVNNTPGMLIGRYAYDALRQGIVLGGALSQEYAGFTDVPATLRQDLVQYERGPANDIGTMFEQISGEQRVEQYRKVGRLDITNSGSSWARDLDFGSGLYGLDDLAELLTFHGINDPQVTSRLERVTTGRYRSDSGDELMTRRYGPLGANRPLSLTREQHGYAVNDIGQDNPSNRPNTDSPNFRSVDGKISYSSMAQLALTPRNKMTVISGAVSLLPTDRVEDPSNPAGLDLLSAAQPLWIGDEPGVQQSSVLFQPTALFDIYKGALAGEIDTPNSFMSNGSYWPADPGSFANQMTSTLFYGHRGPELAMRIAAHASVNMKDIVDSDTDPTIATLVLDAQRSEDIKQYVQAGDFDPDSDTNYQLYPGIAEGNVFDPQSLDPRESFVPNSLPANRKVVNVYGIEAMPVLTEVSVLYAYTDASNRGGANNAGGDKDYSDGAGNEPLFNRTSGEITYPPGPTVPVTIDGNPDPSNPDYLIQVLAFQLHNPYTEPISLGGSGLSNRDPLTRHREYDDEDQIDIDANYQFGYYIEYAGRFYKLGEYIEWYPALLSDSNYFGIDSPIDTPAYGSVANPSGIDPVLGERMLPTNDSSSYPDFIMRNVVLDPGQTRVFYVIADKRFDDATPMTNDDGINPDDRWTRNLKAWGSLPNRFVFPPNTPDNDTDFDLLPDGVTDGYGWTGVAEEWVRSQFTVRQGGAPVMMMEFDPFEGKLLNETTFQDPTVLGGSPLSLDPTRSDAGQVRLWKKIVTPGEETDDPSYNNRTLRNLIENDLLVDRMNIVDENGVATSLTTELFGGGQGDILDTVSYRENLVEEFQGVKVRNDNKGLTVAQWKTVRRADSESFDLPAKGEVTPWMLRSRQDPSKTQIGHSPSAVVAYGLNAANYFDVIGGVGGISEPTAEVEIKADFELQRTMRAFFDMARGMGNEIVQTAALPPHVKNDIMGTGAFGAVEDDVGNSSDTKFPPKVLSVTNTALDLANKAAPEIFVNGSHIGAAPRLADLLLAWGIGATYAPDATRAVNTSIYVNEEWMTTPEAMAVAMGVDLPAPTGPNFDDADAIWVDPYDPDLTPLTKDYLLDDGRLVFDNFVAYLNQDTSENPPEFNPGDDIRRGTGAPMALGVIDHARPIGYLPQVGDPDPTAGVLTAREQLEVALSNPTFGTININTAPIEVLRLLPGLTPSRGQYLKNGAFVNEWWGTSSTETNLPTLNMDIQSQNPDVAAAIIAYRDRLYGVPHTSARPELYPPLSGNDVFYDTTPLNLQPTDETLYVANMLGEFESGLPASPELGMDRATLSGIKGLRPTPGFGSLGELLAVRLNPEFNESTSPLYDSVRWDKLSNLSIQQYGFDTDASGEPVASGIDGNLTILSQLYGGTDAGDIANDYAEKISMANAVLNTLSVRSDFFAVWFVVHGYQESDVKNLQPDDPLIPSVQRRYLMVVDRTSVIEPGDEAKILLFQELPM